MEHGDCFFNKAVRGLRSHPWVIISDPAKDAANVLIVNLTDADKHHDQSCRLDVADHPAVIAKPSIVAYQWANLTSVAKLREAEAAGGLFMKERFSAATMRKILDGAQETDELKGAHRIVLRRQGLIT